VLGETAPTARSVGEAGRLTTLDLDGREPARTPRLGTLGLVEEDTLPVRQTLDALEMEGAIKSFAVGEKMMVKLLVEDIEGVTLR